MRKLTPLVIYCGRFQPFHKGHLSIYNNLIEEFGEKDVYILTSDKVDEDKSPFTFQEKKRIMVSMGIPRVAIQHSGVMYHGYDEEGKTKCDFLKKKRSSYDLDTLRIVFAVSDKDSKRFTFGPKVNGEAAYLQPYVDNHFMDYATKHAYVKFIPTKEFELRGDIIESATKIRNMYSKANSNERLDILSEMYEINDDNELDTLKNVFDFRIPLENSLIDCK